jgi:hypothetical protein
MYFCVVPSFWMCAGQLLDHIGGNINPLRVIQKIPEGLAIDKLRFVEVVAASVACSGQRPVTRRAL